MPKPAPTLSPDQKAALSESLASTAIHLETNGLVHTARPYRDDHGVDLRAFVPGHPATLDIQVKAAYTPFQRTGYQYRVDPTDIPRDASRYHILCVVGTDRLPGLAEFCWLISGEEIKRRARGKRQYVFSVWPNGPRRSQWDAYQLPTDDLGKAVLARLEAAEGRKIPRASGGVSPLARGAIIEDAVTFELVMGSQGRLAVLRPFSDTVGVDLEVLALDSCVSAGAQVKGEFVDALDEQMSVVVRAETFRPRADRYMVIAPYLPRERTLAPVVWVVREDVFGKLAGRSKGKLVFAATPVGGKKGERWLPYRYAPEELAGLFERVIEVCAVGRVRELPDTGR